MKTWLNFIPTKNGKKWRLLREVWYHALDQYEKNSVDYIQKKLAKRLRKVMEQSAGKNEWLSLEAFSSAVIQDMHWAAMANTIISDPHLSQTYWNPNYYPAVPIYIPPEWKKRSMEEIYRIQDMQDEQMLANSPIYENFADAWVSISNTPITLDEWMRYNVATFPYISDTEYFHTELRSFDTRQWHTIRKIDSSRNIVERVKWFVSFFCSEQWNEILGMYCYKNRGAIEELTEFLTDTPVSNEADKEKAMISLSAVYSSIS